MSNNIHKCIHKCVNKQAGTLLMPSTRAMPQQFWRSPAVDIAEVDSAIVNIQANILKGVQVATVNIPGPLMVMRSISQKYPADSWFCKVKNLGACKIPLAAHKKSETFHPAPPSSSALSTTIASPVPATVPCPSTSFDSNGLSSDILGNIKAIVGSDNGGNICSASFGLCKIVRIRWIELFQSFKISRCCQRLGINVCRVEQIHESRRRSNCRCTCGSFGCFGNMSEHMWPAEGRGVVGVVIGVIVVQFDTVDKIVELRRAELNQPSREALRSSHISEGKGYRPENAETTG
ncbi:hypothetical protein B0H14DRAFT_3616774 [Mycena olivaceomarginata]|nr:hypothetical protein B0H14DRAFT_3616774 [Mycena olivaceomarginata]